MFGFINLGSFRGVGMIALQALRILTIIGLTAATASCWIMMVKVGKDKTYFVFESASLFFLSLVCIFLAISEFPVIKFVKDYYRNSWPRFSDRHGLTWLGCAMLLIGCNLLGRLNQPAYDAKKLGDSFFQLVLASGVLTVTFGALNVVCSLTWRDGKNGINARDVRSKGSLASPQQHSLPDYYSSTSRASSVRDEKGRSKFASMFWKKNEDGKQEDRPRINISAPISAHRDVERDASDGERGSPIVPGVKRPDTALHPMHTGRSSYYSEAHMSRF